MSVGSVLAAEIADLIDRAELCVRDGLYVAAEALCQAALAHDPACLRAYVQLYQLARRQRHAPRALAWLFSALDLAPDDFDLRMDQAELLIEVGRRAEAREMLTRLRHTAPGQFGVCLRLGHLARAEDDRAAALAHFRSAFALAPSRQEALGWLVTQCRDHGDLEEAQALLAAAPAESSLHVMLERGRVAEAMGEREAATQAYAAACDAYPGSADAFAHLALAQLALGEPASQQTLAHALALAPDHMEAVLHQASWALAQGRLDDALALCQRCRRAHAQHTAVWLVESCAVQAAHGPDAALALVEDGLRALPGRGELLARQIEIELQAGYYPRLRARLQALAGTIPRHDEHWCVVVRACIMLGLFQLAEIVLAAPPLGPASLRARIAFLRGQLAEARWQTAKALVEYRSALTIAPAAGPVHQDFARVAMVLLETETGYSAMQNYVRLTRGERRLRGEQCKPSQTHISQILDEYRLDAGLVGTLRRLMERPAAQRLPPLRLMVLDVPDSTPVASALLQTLREIGGFQARPVPGPAILPRHIVQFWAQGAPPPDIAAMMQSWRALNPGYRHVVFDDRSARAWLASQGRPEISLAFAAARSFAQRADLLRLAVLARQGGFYADADDRCVGPLDGVVGAGCGFLAYQEDYMTLGNNILGCVPGHPVLAWALAEAVRAINEGSGETLWLSTGPGLITRSFAQYFARSAAGCEVLVGMTILDRPALSPVVAMHCEARYKATSAHWLRDLARGPRSRDATPQEINMMSPV